MPRETRRRTWLAECLNDEQLFTDEPPNWQYLPSSGDAQLERSKRVRLLRKHGLLRLKTILAGCAARARCLSGACPECGRALQRLLAKECQRLLVPNHEYVVVSIVGRTHRKVGELHTLDVASFKAQLSERLRRGQAGIVIGGIDFSFNEYPTRDHLDNRWVPQFWLLVRSANRPHWEKILRDAYRRNDAVPRPVKIKAWDGSIKAPGYALKTNFRRRITVLSSRFSRGQYRECRNTKYDSLRASERVELYRCLHELGLEDRIILLGIRKVQGGFDDPA